jgi:trigger factor
MDVEVTRLPESRVSLKVELAREEVEQALDRTHKQLAQRVNVPGFRKGKAPRAVVERMVGQQLFLEEATEEAIRWGYRKAVDQANVTPIDEAEIQPQPGGQATVRPGEAFQFDATVAVRPEVQLPDYHTIRIDRPVVEVTDEDVDSVLETLRERTATLEPVARPAQIGDVVTMNIVGRAGGEEVINNDNADFELRDEEEEQPDTVLPGLSRELVGVNRGEIKEVALPLPELYSNQELAGRTLFLRILVKEIKRKVLPPLDDELAQSVSEFQTLDGLREALRSNLALERKLEADEKLVSEAVEAVTSRTFVEIPPVLVEEEIDRMLEDMDRAFDQRHLSFQAYLETAGKTEDDVRHEMRDTATQNVKASLVLGAIADAEDIGVQNREVDAALEDLLRRTNASEGERRRLRSSNAVRSNIRSRLRRQRAIQKLVEIVSGGEEVAPEAAEAVADQTAAAAEDTEETLAVEVGG